MGAPEKRQPTNDSAIQRLGVAPLLRAAARRIREHQPKRAIPPAVLYALVALGVLPLLLLSLRVLALPGGSTGLLALGDWLNRHLSLLWIPPADRDVVLYIVQLPLAALLVAVTRLSLGIRVLGFRAILIGIGFQEIGILPSLLLIAVVALTVVIVRPWMRRSGMPLYARVATILCLVAATMVGGLLLGEALSSSILWSFAFFPVVILAMLAESIADTVARENTAMAAWRTGATIALALLIAGISQITLLRELVLACPELILTQLVLVVLVAELLDWRLFEGLPAGQGSGAADGDALASATLPPIAVVRNRWNTGVLRHAGNEAPASYRQRSVQPLVDALRTRGHTVKVIEGDGQLLEGLRALAPRSQHASAVPALVLNCAAGVQGRGRLCQIPALCEMIGVPYTGPDALAMATLADRALLLQTLRAHGLHTPAYCEPAALNTFVRDQDGPYAVRGRFDAEHRPLRARDKAALQRTVKRAQSRFDEVLIEAEGSGRSLRVVVLQAAHGCEPGAAPEVLPALEWRSGTRRYQPAAGLSAAQVQAVAEIARRTFSVLRCRDVARIDLRLRDDGTVCVLGLRTVDLLSPRGAVACAAAAAGMDYVALLERLINGALQRLGTPAAHATTNAAARGAATASEQHEQPKQAEHTDRPAHTVCHLTPGSTSRQPAHSEINNPQTSANSARRGA
jgi:D-alanine-D-alanine ligase-like ATP-grasp enzyme